MLKVSFFIFLSITVLSVNSNGDGLLLVMDIAFIMFVVKVFRVLMRVAVVGVDGGVVDVGVVGDVDVVDDGVVD